MMQDIILVQVLRINSDWTCSGSNIKDLVWDQYEGPGLGAGGRPGDTEKIPSFSYVENNLQVPKA